MGITVNGLAILTDTPDLGRYYAEHVIGVPGAFGMIVENYRGFAETMRLKLLQEIRGGPFSGQPPAHRFAETRRHDAAVPHTDVGSLSPGILDRKFHEVTWQRAREA